MEVGSQTFQAVSVTPSQNSSLRNGRARSPAGGTTRSRGSPPAGTPPTRGRGPYREHRTMQRSCRLLTRDAAYPSRGSSISLPKKPPEWAEDPTKCRPPGRASWAIDCGRAATGTIAEQLASHRLIAQSRHAARAASSQVTDRAVGPDSYTRRAQHPLAATSPERSVARMEPDAYKHVLSFAFMVEELLRWLVADLPRHARAGRCAGLLHPHARARAVGHRRRRGAASPQQRHGVAGAPARARRGRCGRAGRAGGPDRFTARRRRRAARIVRAVAVPGGDAGVSVHRGLSDAVAHPQLRGQLPHGAVAGPAVPLHRPPGAGAAHRALHRQATLDRRTDGSSTW